MNSSRTYHPITRWQLARRWATAAAAVVATYTLYAWTVAPRLEPHEDLVPATHHAALAPDNQPRPSQLLVEQLFPADAWQRQANVKVLQTRQGLMLFLEYQPFPDGRIEVTPLTMILHEMRRRGPNEAEGTAESAAIVIDAPQGAELQMAEPLGLGSGSGHVVGGRIHGVVTVRRAVRDDDSDQPLEITTSNLSFSPSRITTRDPVSFRYGRSQGSGRDVLIELADRPPRATKEPGEIIAGLRHMEVTHLDRLTIEADPELARDRQAPGSAALAGDLTVLCEGPLQIDFSQRIATLVDHVQLHSVQSPSIAPPGAAPASSYDDALLCDKLQVCWEPAADRESRPPDPAPDGAASQSAAASSRRAQWIVRRVTALGNVMLNAPSHDARIDADWLNYDFQTGEFWVRVDAPRDGVAAATEGQRPARLTRGRQFVESPNLRYVPGPDGRLGVLDAAGPGVLGQRATPDGAQQGLTIGWQSQLTIRPDSSPRKHIVTLDGGARLQLDDGSYLAAGRFHLWLWETLVEGADGVAQWQLAPAKFLAERDVSIDWPEVAGTTDELAAFWPDPGQAVSALGRRANLVWRTMRVALSQPTSGRYVTAEPTTAAPGNIENQDGRDLTNVAGNRPPSSKLRFQCRSVQAAIAPNGGQSVALEELALDGGVVVTEDFQGGTAPPGPTPLRIQGQALRMIHQGNQAFRLMVFGNPSTGAAVIGRGLHLVGETVQLDQAANSLWVEGPGQMDVESSGSQANFGMFATRAEASADRALPAVSSSQPSHTHVTWQGGMVFDGQQFYAEDDVETTTRQAGDDGSITVSRTASYSLRMTLAERVDFRQASSSAASETPALAALVLACQAATANNVFPRPKALAASHPLASENSPPDSLAADRQHVLLENVRQAADGQLVGVHRLAARTVAIDATTGKVHCAGGGTAMVHEWKPPTASSDRSLLPSTKGRDATAEHQPIEFLRIEFERSLDASTEGKQIKFAGRVAAVFGRVAEWSDAPSVDARDRRGGGQMWLQCEELQMVEWESRAGNQAELNATGGVYVKGDMFEAQAHRLSFNRATQLLVFDAEGESPAQLWQQQPGQPRNHLAATQIRYNLGDGTYNFVGLRQIDMTHGAPAPPRRPSR